MRRRNHIPLVVGLAVSIGLHAAAYVMVRSAPDTRLQMFGRERPIEVALVVEQSPPKPLEPPKQAPVTPPPKSAAPSRPRQVPPTPSPPVDDRPTNDTPPAPQQPVAPRPTLIPTGAFALTLDAGVYADEEDFSGLRAPLAPQDLVGELTKETIGRGKVDRGLVNPYYVTLGKALIKHWDADRSVSKKGLAGFQEQFVQNAKVFNEIWMDKAAQYGATGAAIDAPVTNDSTSRRTSVTTNNIQGITGVDLESRKEVSRQMREQFKATRRATIRVVQDAQGKLVKVELLSPSNDSNVDREALADVRAAAEKLPPPPPEALEGRTELRSTWAFELVVSISPPVPTFTFEFDEALGFIDARLPLDRRIYKKVRLVSVD